MQPRELHGVVLAQRPVRAMEHRDLGGESLELAQHLGFAHAALGADQQLGEGDE